jgi:hypothetical protein
VYWNTGRAKDLVNLFGGETLRKREVEDNKYQQKHPQYAHQEKQKYLSPSSPPH